MGSIFLSYSRDDGPRAEALARVLEKAGHEVWWDRRIDSGDEFASEIEAALEKADIILVAWSEHSGKSAWVRDEAAIGRDEGRLLPVTIDGCRPPIGFRQFQTLDLAGWKGGERDRRTAELLRSVERRLNAKSGEAPSRAEPEARPLIRRPALRRWHFGAIALALLLIVGTAAAILIPRLHSEAEPASLAVLPFKNMSAGDPYFAEGVAEEISDRLSREPQFRVTGRTSASLFKDAADLRDVGRRLRVAYVLEGSVRSAGREVRVDVSLVETKRGIRLWSEDFRGSLNDMFAIQDNIGQQVAAHVRRQLIRQAASSATKTRGDVYALYLTARSLMRQREPGKLDAAVDLLQRAVQLDPNFAPAWARLALARQLDRFYAHPNQVDAPRADEIRDVEHAIALAPNLADAHAILGLFLSGSLKAEENRRARLELERAVTLDPGNAEAWYWLSALPQSNVEFEGALDALRRTARIDPFFVHSNHFAPLAWDMGYRGEATQNVENRIANNPDPFLREMARSQLALLQYDLSGAYERAKAARAIALPDQKEIAEGTMGSVLLRLRLLDEAERIVPAPLVDLRRGKFTFPTSFRQAFPSADEFWRFNSDEDHYLTRVLLKTGRSRELVAVYDDAFSSPDDMAKRYPRFGIVLNAPLLAIALHQAGRRGEAIRLVMIADGICRSVLGTSHVPAGFRVMCSRVAALTGRNDDAVHDLQQAVAAGWRPSEGEYPAVTDEPAYGGLRNDPRLKRIDAILAADVARERRELIASGI
jgi:adenylate cyclase